MINAAPESANQLFVCDVLRRTEVTPNEKDVISPSTQWEIETNMVYRDALEC